MTEGTAPSGRRVLTAGHLAGRALAQAFEGEPAARPGQYLAAFKQAAQQAGIPLRIVALVDGLFAYTRAQDWADGRPIVWPSNETLGARLGLSRSGVKHLIRAALAAGVMVAVDSPNGQRYGHRDREGHIVTAYGFDLSPLAARYDEFRNIAAADKAERKERQTLRARATHVRNEILELAALGAIQLPNAGGWKLRHDRAYALWTASRSTDDLGLIEPVVLELEALRSSTEQALNDVHERSEINPMGSENEPHNTITTDLQASKEATNSNLSAPPQTVGGLPPSNTKESAPGEAGADHRSLPQRKRYVEPPSPARNDDDTLRGFPATPLTVLAIAPVFKDYGPSEWPDWRSILDAARLIAHSLGVSQAAWGQACQIMGRPQAAVAVAVIAARHKRGEIRSAGGFLRALVERHQKGTLHLDRTLYGLTSGKTTH